MTQDITTTGPSRRQIAKGAAWAVPAVSVAAAAPALAASPSSCEPGTLNVAAVCPPIIGLNTRNIYFTVSNPAGSDCEIPAGTALSLNLAGLVGLNVSLLNGINADVLFSDPSNATLVAPLAPGESIEVEVFPPSLLNAGVAGSASLSIEGSSASTNYTVVNILGGLLQVALCR